ncbi:unnamed protein product [Aspergillus oryzae RIB40]|uniref:DNA, SC012 n=1 Tax=Aspergillus oryzae (strain ATCC 42149 / RIB 40) TaxID=510516 RepID=Q2UCJ3_ASPOR|nr:unnamed protein product [Aspergillus oryzae RIB40]BAE60722.1 unnamed protein product [Aspergillus oryzae RIB40]
MKIDLLNLRCKAVQAINDALKYQPPDRVNDALIGAIAKMGSYEAMYGDMASYSVHMRGLTRAVGMRGGLSMLGLNGLLRRIVVWIDRNAAFLHGSALYYPGATFAPAWDQELIGSSLFFILPPVFFHSPVDDRNVALTS